MKIYPTEKLILSLADGSGIITLKYCVEKIGRKHHTNANKHIGATLSKMVKKCLVIRVATGIFKIARQIEPELF